MIVIAVILIVLFLGVFSAVYRVTGNDWMDDLWDFLRGTVVGTFDLRAPFLGDCGLVLFGHQ